MDWAAAQDSLLHSALCYSLACPSTLLYIRGFINPLLGKFYPNHLWLFSDPSMPSLWSTGAKVHLASWGRIGPIRHSPFTGIDDDTFTTMYQTSALSRRVRVLRPWQDQHCEDHAWELAVPASESYMVFETFEQVFAKTSKAKQLPSSSW